MPNWCDNKVRIEGPVDKIYDMAKAVEEERLLQYLVPVEQGYHTQIEAWGTKWDISEPYMEHNVEDGVIEASFMTAWGPPDTAFDTYLMNNDDVTIENYFYEPGNAFAGVDGESVELPMISDDPVWEEDGLLQAVDNVFNIREGMIEWETYDIEDNLE